MSLTQPGLCLLIISGLVIFQVIGLPDTLTVQATDDIYAAGHSTLPVTLFPGSFPPSVTIAAAPGQLLTFSNIMGTVGCNFFITNGPDGTCFPGVDTTVSSYGGLSGISVSQANMFLVGVFLDTAEPSGAGPSVLRYNYGTPNSANTTDTSFSPETDQVFFIGDGLTGTGSGQEQVFHVPVGAVRLYLGFADSFDSVPSFYADDVGFLTATFAFTTEAASTPELGTAYLVAVGLLSGILYYRSDMRAGSKTKSYRPQLP